MTRGISQHPYWSWSDKMQERLIIIGASALGREFCSYARDCGMTVAGFLDDRANILDGYVGYPAILASPEAYDIRPGDRFICSVGETEARARYVALIESRGGRFVSLVHPSAHVGFNVRIGEGSVIRPLAAVGNDVVIGRHVILGMQSQVAHDCHVGDCVTISPGCHIAGWCTIRDRAFLGIHSAVVPHVDLGADGKVFVAAGAIVTQSFGQGTLMGVPAHLHYTT